MQHLINCAANVVSEEQEAAADADADAVAEAVPGRAT